MGVLDVVARAGGQVDRVAFGEGLFAIRGDEDALVFHDPEPEFHLVITPLDALMPGLDGLAVDECNGFQAPVFCAHRPELMPANRTRAVADRQHVFPVANRARAAWRRVDVFAQNEVFEPIVIHVVEHLMVNVGGQIDRIPRADGKPVFSDQDFAAAAEDIIGLFDLRVFVVVRGLAPLQRVLDNALKIVQLVRVFVCAFGGGVSVFNPGQRIALKCATSGCWSRQFLMCAMFVSFRGVGKDFCDAIKLARLANVATKYDPSPGGAFSCLLYFRASTGASPLRFCGVGFRLSSVQSAQSV